MSSIVLDIRTFRIKAFTFKPRVIHILLDYWEGVDWLQKASGEGKVTRWECPGEPHEHGYAQQLESRAILLEPSLGCVGAG